GEEKTWFAAENVAEFAIEGLEGGYCEEIPSSTRATKLATMFQLGENSETPVALMMTAALSRHHRPGATFLRHPTHPLQLPYLAASTIRPRGRLTRWQSSLSGSIPSSRSQCFRTSSQRSCCPLQRA